MLSFLRKFRQNDNISAAKYIYIISLCLLKEFPVIPRSIFSHLSLLTVVGAGLILGLRPANERRCYFAIVVYRVNSTETH